MSKSTVDKKEFAEMITILKTWVEDSGQGKMFSSDYAGKVFVAVTRGLRLAVQPEYEPITQVAEAVVDHRYDDALRTLKNIEQIYHARNPN